MSLHLQEFIALAGDCADATPANAPPFARHLVDAYEELQREAKASEAKAEDIAYEWGRTLARIERTKESRWQVLP